jgi:hypothetical protein
MARGVPSEFAPPDVLSTVRKSFAVFVCPLLSVSASAFFDLLFVFFHGAHPALNSSATNNRRELSRLPRCDLTRLYYVELPD